MKILVSCPTTAPFVRSVTAALHKDKALRQFATTIAYSPSSFWQQLLFGLSPGIRRKFMRRSLELPSDLVAQYPLRELVRIITDRSDSSGRLGDIVWEWAEHGFDKWVSSKLDDTLDAIYSFEHASLESFRRAKLLGIKRIYDVPAPEHLFTHNIINFEVEKFPSLNTAYFKRTQKLLSRRTARRHAEFSEASLVIANSPYTKASYAAAGLDDSKITVIPYGAPQVPPPPPYEAKPSQKLCVIWAGTFSIRKGAHYVLEAFSKHGLGKGVSLQVYGTIDLPKELLADCTNSGITFHGSVSQSELFAAYQSAEALLFPTLTDGFGMVITEALAHGLPVITTSAAGAGYLIEEKKNGLTIDAASSRSICEALDWCIQHRGELHSMRNYCHESSQKRTWQDYETDLLKVVTQHVS